MLPVLVALALTSPTAQAQSVVLGISPERDLSQGGNWGRTFPTADGWRFTYAFNQDYWVAELDVSDDGWDVVESSARQITDQGVFSDHAIERCPDGSLLHVASANLDVPNDSAWATRLSVDFSPVAGAWIDKREDGRAHNDMAIVCGDTAQGATFQDFGAQQVLFFHVQDDATSTDTTQVGGDLIMTGGDLAQHPDQDQLLVTGGVVDGGVQIAALDSSLAMVDNTVLDVVDGPLTAYWPQALLPVGDHFLVAFMARDQSAGWNADTGNVYLAVVDSELQLVEVVQVSELSPPDGGMRPGIARSGDTLVLTWDRNNELFLYELQLDLEALGVDPADEETGWPGGSDGGWADGGSTDDPAGDTDSDTDSDDDGGCGCASAPAGAPLALLGTVLVGIVGRRRATYRR